MTPSCNMANRFGLATSFWSDDSLAVIAAPIQGVVAFKPTAALDKQSMWDVVKIVQRLAKEQHCAI